MIFFAFYIDFSINMNLSILQKYLLKFCYGLCWIYKSEAIYVIIPLW